MNEELTEEEMRRALFGGAEPLAQASALPVQDTLSDIVIIEPAKAAEKKKVFWPIPNLLSSSIRAKA